jgi:hypothetical protein
MDTSPDATQDEYPIQNEDNTSLIAIIIEIIFGMGGALGMGWLYVGNFGRAALIFTGYIIFCIIEAVLGFITLGMAAFCFAPLNVLAIAFSSVKLREYIRHTGAIGSMLYVVIAFVLFLAFAVIAVAVVIFFLLGGVKTS